MEKFAWKARIIEGKVDEYKRRHREIWPELVEVLRNAGIRNYSIWRLGNELFGYFECINGVDFAEKTQAQSEVVDRWNEYMRDVLLMEMDPQTGAQPKMEQVFDLFSPDSA
ncbi:MAG: L-rhamnose mutarotase [Planctomycetia bacterium]|nr:L-rhamnose mutarotase [Planctomycetia bacterium]